MPRIKSIESNVPEVHRKELKRFIAKLKRSDKKWGTHYESFVQRLMEIFSDNPPTSWRFLNTTYQFPSFRVVNLKSGRTTFFLHVCDDRLIISHKFFMPQFEPLFEQQHGFYGTANVHIVDFSKFGPKKQLPYLEAIRKMLDQPDLLSINFAAH